MFTGKINSRINDHITSRELNDFPELKCRYQIFHAFAFAFVSAFLLRHVCRAEIKPQWEPLKSSKDFYPSPGFLHKKRIWAQLSKVSEQVK